MFHSNYECKMKYIINDYLGAVLERRNIKILNPIRLQDFECQEQEVFTYYTPKQYHLPYQGWKIHISSFYDNYRRVLDKVVGYCAKEKIAFKFINREEIFFYNISKNESRTSSGKFITIYPENETNFKKYVCDLYVLLKEEHGPYILTDRLFKDSKVIYYRYGVINANNLKENERPCIISPDGKYVEDIEGPYYKKPDFVKEPFPNQDDFNNNEILLHNRYAVRKALHFSNGGGIYLAIDKVTNKEVVVKEARAYIGLNEQNTMIHLRQNEEKMIKDLQETGLVPKYIDSFEEQENYFIVIEKIEGKTIQELYPEKCIILYNPMEQENVNKMINTYIRLFNKLLNAVSLFHQKHLIFNDISASNIMIKKDESVKFIDLENAYTVEDSQKHNYEIVSKLYTDKEFYNRDSYQKDKQKLGYLFLSMICSSNRLLQVDHTGNVTLRIFRSVIKDYGIPEIIENTVLELINNPYCILEELAQRLEIYEFVDIPRKKHPNILCSECVKHELEDIKKYIRKNSNQINILTKFVFNDVLTEFFNKDCISNSKDEREYMVNKWYTELMNRIDSNLPMIQERDIWLEEGLIGVGIYLMILNKYDWGKWGGNHEFQKMLETIFYKINEICEKNTWIYNDSNYKKYQLGYFFLEYYSLQEDESIIQRVDKIIEDLVQNLGRVNNKRQMSFMNKVYSPYLINGTSGLLTILLKYAMIRKDNKYDELIRELLESIDVLYPKSINLFTGLAGIAYTYVLAFEYFNESKYLHRAFERFRLLKLYSIEGDDGKFYPNEDMVGVSLDFENGMTGIYFFMMKLYQRIEGEYID